MEDTSVERYRRVRRRREEWRSVVNRYEGSGLSREEFCRREQISLSSLSRWSRLVREAEISSKGFMELRPQGERRSSRVELEFSSGVILRIWD
ncbi:MAG TPA: hypothetical protein VI895_08550 [Bdellovibrionota bacterium]|nr:hypothetical protein [Bdellovibrionota bacterium]